MKIWILAPNENWIVDEMAKQFKSDNPKICTDDIKEADVVWAMADWCFDKIPYSYLLLGKPIVTMLHHFVPEKFDSNSEAFFRRRDRFTTLYTALNFRTRDFVVEKNLTQKPIHIVPCWVHTESWKKTGKKEELRKKYKIPDDAYTIGSFQRDTEGYDLKSPKLEKGPDLFVDFVIKKWNSWKDEEQKEQKMPFVVLAGWRRQYVMKRLDEEGIPYIYLERPSQEIVNELYQTLDLYPVTSRYEGGPQAFGEAGAIGIPVVSRPVGIAEIVLPKTSIGDDVFYAIPSVPNVDDLKTPKGYSKYIEILKSVIKK